MDMKREFEIEEKDDGRTIASMDNLDGRGILGSWFGAISPAVREEVFGRHNSEKTYGDELSPEDRRALIKYTLKYALGIGAIFAVAFGIVIFILTRIW